MKICPNCKNNIDDASVFCAVCGAPVATPEYTQQVPPQPTVEYAQTVPPQGAYQVPPQGVPYYTTPPQEAQPVVDQFDHTSEFDAKDIEENKLYALIVYLLGVLGIVIALLLKNDSPYLKFHIKQGVKLVVVETIVSLATALLCWTCIALVVGSIALVALAVVQIICIIDVCNGKAKEAAIVRNFKFLN